MRLCRFGTALIACVLFMSGCATKAVEYTQIIPDTVRNGAKESISAGETIVQGETLYPAEVSEEMLVAGSDCIVGGTIVSAVIHKQMLPNEAAQYTMHYTVKVADVFMDRSGRHKADEELLLVTTLPESRYADTTSGETLSVLSTEGPELYEGMVYILNLRAAEDATYFQLVCPWIRPIEVSSRQEYLFHDTWKSLSAHSMRVLCDGAATSYRYRNDDRFITDLQAVIDRYC